jgi:hypothetical protein
MASKTWGASVGTAVGGTTASVGVGLGSGEEHAPNSRLIPASRVIIEYSLLLIRVFIYFPFSHFHLSLLFMVCWFNSPAEY